MKKIEIISRGVVFSKNKILVCKNKGNKNYFLPGGHVEFGEFSQNALLRELKEELSLEAEETDFIGTIENIYKARGETHQEINFLYLVKCGKLNIKSNEEHIEFFLFSQEELKEKDVRPKKIKKALLKWKSDEEIFHITTKD